MNPTLVCLLQSALRRSIERMLAGVVKPKRKSRLALSRRPSKAATTPTAPTQLPVTANHCSTTSSSSQSSPNDSSSSHSYTVRAPRQPCPESPLPTVTEREEPAIDESAQQTRATEFLETCRLVTANASTGGTDSQQHGRLLRILGGGGGGHSRQGDERNPPVPTVTEITHGGEDRKNGIYSLRETSCVGGSSSPVVARAPLRCLTDRQPNALTHQHAPAPVAPAPVPGMSTACVTIGHKEEKIAAEGKEKENITEGRSTTLLSPTCSLTKSGRVPNAFAVVAATAGDDGGEVGRSGSGKRGRKRSTKNNEITAAGGSIGCRTKTAIAAAPDHDDHDNDKDFQSQHQLSSRKRQRPKAIKRPSRRQPPSPPQRPPPSASAQPQRHIEEPEKRAVKKELEGEGSQTVDASSRHCEELGTPSAKVGGEGAGLAAKNTEQRCPVCGSALWGLDIRAREVRFLGQLYLRLRLLFVLYV